jgi:hypothetical protein
MQKLTGSIMKLASRKAVAVLVALLAPACSTDFADQPLVVGDPNTQGLGTSKGGILVLDCTDQAGFTLLMDMDGASQQLRLLVDGLYLTVNSSPPYEYVLVGSGGGSVFGVVGACPGGVVNGQPVVGGFPAGIHTLTLEREDGSTLASTTQDFVARAWNTVVVYGSWTQPVVDFFSDAVPAIADTRLERVLNLTTTKETLTISVCLGAAPCTVSTLAYGESLVATLAATDPDPTAFFPQESTTVQLSLMPGSPVIFIVSPSEY